MANSINGIPASDPLNVAQSGQFVIPEFDSIEFSYYGSTNNIELQTFKKDGNIVSALFYTYVNGAVADDDRIASISFD